MNLSEKCSCPCPKAGHLEALSFFLFLSVLSFFFFFSRICGGKRAEQAGKSYFSSSYTPHSSRWLNQCRYPGQRITARKSCTICFVKNFFFFPWWCGFMEFGSCPVSEISDFCRVSPGWTWTSSGPQGEMWRHCPACPALCCLHLDVFGGNVPVRRGWGYLGAEGRLTLRCSSWRRTNAWYPAVFTALSYVPLASMKTTSGENLQAQPRNCVLFLHQS